MSFITPKNNLVDAFITYHVNETLNAINTRLLQGAPHIVVTIPDVLESVKPSIIANVRAALDNAGYRDHDIYENTVFGRTMTTIQLENPLYEK